MEDIFDWPGKSDKDSGAEHPAILHMLEVGACAEKLICEHTTFRKLTDAQRQALVVLVILHDVGKLSESFLALIRQGITGGPRHWEISDYLLCEVLDELLVNLGADNWVRAELYAAVAGHHGQPPARASGNRRERRKKQRAVGYGKQAARKWVRTLLEQFPNASLEGMTVDEAKTMSWALSGLTSISDWVGSNIAWFPFQNCRRGVGTALAESRNRAEKAVQEAGLEPAKLIKSNPGTLLQLACLRPMQEAASAVVLREGPQLVIVEDSTGSGKTEAALILAQRMMAGGKARGIFFALPTMATSDAMFERMQTTATRLFDTLPSIVLTHSRAKLSKATKDLQGVMSDATPETDGAAWLTDDRRRSVLATVGVGTIDQALLGILPTRFSTIRLFGLADKVLIIDEAHSYDPYMEEELKALLQMQSRLGGSAILMTATLPLELRRKYVRAFQKGLLTQNHDLSDACYPSIHVVDHEVSSHSVEPVNARTVKVERIADVKSTLKLLETATKDGAACVWIRNAVDDAISATKSLKQRGIRTDLLHARFALVDRLSHEREVTRRFGKHGEDRSGRVLVATQVVEASLDLDFDVMVSDLAPVGSLIQRAGRLWRHMDVRPDSKRPNSGPILHVLSPDPKVVKGRDWLQSVLQGGAWVYRLDHQWLTAKAVFDAGEIVTPDGLRDLVEAVHGDCIPYVPEILEPDQDRADAEACADAGIARLNAVDPSLGYLNGIGDAVSSDAKFPTRLGEKQVTIVLARRVGDRLISWAREEDSRTAWALAEVSASSKRFRDFLPDQNAQEILNVKESWPEWRQEAHSLCLVEEDGTIGEKLLYDTEFGLQIA